MTAKTARNMMPKKVKRVRVFRTASDTGLDGLGFIAHRLNEASAMPPGAMRDAWSTALRIVSAAVPDPLWKAPEPNVRTRGGVVQVTGPTIATGAIRPAASLAAALVDFNHEAQRTPVNFAVKYSRAPRGAEYDVVNLSPQILASGPLGDALWFLWRFFFHDDRWRRLKRCVQCGAWIVDATTTNKRYLCDDPKCETRYWSRLRRRQRKEEKQRQGQERKRTDFKHRR
jgi:hypothetical protein